MYNKCLGIFVREPLAGTVKTRLSPALTADEATRLYAAFVRDLFGRLNDLRKFRVTAFWTGDSDSSLREMAPDRIQFARQRGDDLGKRMNAALTDLLDGGACRGAVLIGSDSPDVPSQYIKRAFVKLRTADVVIGPATDGGYYLIGVRKPTPAVFENVDWGSPRVLEQTVRNVNAAGLKLALLPVWYDVDDAESLGLLRSLIHARRVAGGVTLPATTAVLNDLDT